MCMYIHSIKNAKARGQIKKLITLITDTLFKLFADQSNVYNLRNNDQKFNCQ